MPPGRSGATSRVPADRGKNTRSAAEWGRDGMRPVREMIVPGFRAGGVWWGIQKGEKANACPGKQGREAVRRISAGACRALGLRDGSLLVSSTGVIGVPLPTGKITAAIPGLCSSLSPGGIPRAGEAILTTDAYPKRGVRKVRVRGGTVTLGGIAKGAGMIAPGMGTMLAYVFTDAALRSSDLRSVFREAAALSFKRIVVDGGR